MAVDRFPVEAGHVRRFAEAIGDPNPVYHDPDYASGTEAGGLIAPPTFVFADVSYDPEWIMRPTVEEPWFGSGRSPSGAPAPRSNGGSRLHAEQHFEYHAPVRPGDVLSVETTIGERWHKRSERAGTLEFTEYVTQYTNQDGVLVVTARQVKVVTSRIIGGSRRGPASE